MAWNTMIDIFKELRSLNTDCLTLGNHKEVVFLTYDQTYPNIASYGDGGTHAIAAITSLVCNGYDKMLSNVYKDKSTYDVRTYVHVVAVKYSGIVEKEFVPYMKNHASMSPDQINWSDEFGYNVRQWFNDFIILKYHGVIEKELAKLKVIQAHL